jgi:hypothetical protein
MREIDLRQEQPSLSELLQFATDNPVLIRNQNGVEFILEAADAFDREVAELSRSRRFRSFLEERSKEPGKTRLEEIDRRLSQAEAAIADQS